jgi:hypothetical protein
VCAVIRVSGSCARRHPRAGEDGAIVGLRKQACTNTSTYTRWPFEDSYSLIYLSISFELLASHYHRDRESSWRGSAIATLWEDGD